MDKPEKLGIEKLKAINGGAAQKKAKCPKCGKTEMIIRFKRFECLACGYVRRM